MKLSEKLIALRKEKGWSQEDFAENYEQISRIRMEAFLKTKYKFSH